MKVFILFGKIFNLNIVAITSPTDAGWKVTSDDVATLKKALVNVLNETFCKQLTATTQNESGVDKEFVNALLRRIKRLIQFAPVK